MDGGPIVSVPLAPAVSRRMEPPFADELVDLWWGLPCLYDPWREIRTTRIERREKSFRPSPVGIEVQIIPVNLRWEEDGEPWCDDLVAFAPVGNSFWLWSGEGRWLNNDLPIWWRHIEGDGAGPLRISESIPEWLASKRLARLAGYRKEEWPVFPLRAEALHDLYDLPTAIEVADGAMGLKIRDFLLRPAGRLPCIQVPC